MQIFNMLNSGCGTLASCKATRYADTVACAMWHVLGVSFWYELCWVSLLAPVGCVGRFGFPCLYSAL